MLPPLPPLRVAARGQEGGAWVRHCIRFGSLCVTVSIVPEGPAKPTQCRAESGRMRRRLVWAVAALLLAATFCQSQVRIDGAVGAVRRAGLVGLLFAALALLQVLAKRACKPATSSSRIGYLRFDPPATTAAARLRRRCPVPPPPALPTPCTLPLSSYVQAQQGLQPLSPQLGLPQQAAAQAATPQQPGAGALQQEPMPGLSPQATEVVASCPQSSFYAGRGAITLRLLLLWLLPLPAMRDGRLRLQAVSCGGAERPTLRRCSAPGHAGAGPPTGTSTLLELLPFPNPIPCIENFYVGATLLGAVNGTDSLGACCLLCRCERKGRGCMCTGLRLLPCTVHGGLSCASLRMLCCTTDASLRFQSPQH